MKRYLAVLAVVGVAACAPPAPPPADLVLSRNPTAPIGSQVDVMARDLAGDWFVRQGRAESWPFTAGGTTFETSGTGFVIPAIGETCDDMGLCTEVQQSIRFSQTLPGRWVSDNVNFSDKAGLPHEIWVYWMDFDRRTMAIGNPNGNAVAILDRKATGGRDRITAARDILDWYGYDISALSEVSR